MHKGIFINGAVAIAAVVCGWMASRGPWQMLGLQQDRTARQQAEMRKSENEREQLLREEAHFRSSVGREELARGQGYLAPGEKALGAE